MLPIRKASLNIIIWLDQLTDDLNGELDWILFDELHRLWLHFL